MLNVKKNKLILTVISIFLIVGSIFPSVSMAKPQTTNHSTIAARAKRTNVKHRAKTVKRKVQTNKRQKHSVKRKVHAKKRKTVRRKSSRNKAAKNRARRPEPQSNPEAKVAIISCCYGGYEVTTKPVVEQSVPCDKIFFTDNPKINNHGNWIIDTNPYHLTNNKYLDTDYTNSWKNNKTNYMISKYYKAQFMDIPRLQKYDYILVIDGTIEITNKDCIKMFIEKVEKEKTNMICWMHDFRDGELYNEAIASSRDNRWTSTKFREQDQPFQDVLSQYKSYVSNGYMTEYWKNQSTHKDYGVFCTGFSFYKINNYTKKFLDLWYEEILKWTTQCQVSFAYVLQMLQKNNDYKFSVLPDDLVKGTCHRKSNVHVLIGHGK